MPLPAPDVPPAMVQNSIPAPELSVPAPERPEARGQPCYHPVHGPCRADVPAWPHHSPVHTALLSHPGQGLTLVAFSGLVLTPSCWPKSQPGHGFLSPRWCLKPEAGGASADPWPIHLLIPTVARLNVGVWCCVRLSLILIPH